jgi:hypothetical protein
MRKTSRCGDSPIGEPDAGNPPVRFGGRGGANQCSIPTPIEPAARLLGGGLWGEARVRSLAIPGLLGDNRWDAGSTLGLVGRAGRRTPCAGRAVILTAVQSLRLLVRKEGWGGDGQSLNGAGPAGWHRESGSRLPQSKGLRPGWVGECLLGDNRRDAGCTLGLVGRGWQAHSVREREL